MTAADVDACRILDLRLALPTLAVWAGCLIGFYAYGAALWVLLAVGGFVAAGLVAARRRRRYIAMLWAVCFVAGIVVAWAQMTAATRDPASMAAGDGQWLTAHLVVTGEPAELANRFGGPPQWRVPSRSVAVDRGGAGLVRSDIAVTVFGTGDGWADLVPRQRITVSGTATTDLFSVIPGVVIRGRTAPVVTGQPPWWATWAAPARAALVDIADELGGDRGGLLRGLVVGDTRGMSTELNDDAKVAGLTHLTAVSGTHMAIVAGMVLVVLRRFGPRWAALGSAVAVVGMVILVGPAASVLRSGMMGMIGVAGVMAGRARSTVSVLAAAVFVLLLADPALAVSIGFVLSVLATSALVLIAPAWIRALTARRVPGGWATIVAVPLAAHLATVPVVAGFSGTVSLVAVIANMAVTPVVAPALLLGVLTILVAPWWPGAAALIARVDSPLLGWIISVAHGTARWDFAAISWRTGALAALALAGIIVAALMTLRIGAVRAAVIAAALGALIVVVPARMVSPGWPADGWVMTGCDVGQGDGMVLATGRPGVAIVVDTGEEPGPIASCLRDLDVHEVPLVVLTHMHADHIGGLDGVLDATAVAAIGVGLGAVDDPAFDGVARTAAARGIPVVELTAGRRWQVGGLVFEVLGPERVFKGTDADANNNSVVLRAEKEEVSMLLTGDIELAAQAALLRSGVDLRADILKQPHHGSARLLPEFVAAVSPQVAVIGVGADNGYGHPAEAALAADDAAGVSVVLRTDTDGDVQVVAADGGLATVTRAGS